MLFTLYILHIVNIVVKKLLLPSPEKWHFGCKNCIFSHSFWPRWLKKHKTKQMYKKITFAIFKISFQHFIFQDFRKLKLWCSAYGLCKRNKTINFVPSVELLEKMHFSQGNQKTYIFYTNCFLYILQKKSRNKLCVEPYDTYWLFRMFFS